MPIYVILLWVVWNKNKNKLVFDQSELETQGVLLYLKVVGQFRPIDPHF